jgi:hypothetical protein
MDVLKNRRIGKIALIVVSAASVVCGEQTTNENDVLTTETQARGYWVDSSSGLMWAARDNGKDVNWHQATSYCQKLRIGGYSDWRLATIDQLAELIDIRAFAPEHVGTSSILHFNMDRKVHGGLLVTGQVWSSSQNVDDRGKLIGNAWYFDFVDVRRSDDDGDVGLLDRYDKRALCVRDSVAAHSALMGSQKVPATYADSKTGLIWVAQDNGKDVNVAEAMQYCRDLRVDGRSDWRLATIEELENIQDLGSEGPGNATSQAGVAPINHGVGWLELTGNPWSTSFVATNLRFRWYLSRKSGTRVFDDPSFSRAMRALCVHGSLPPRGTRSGAAASAGETQSPAQSTQTAGYWSDPATGLMWSAMNGVSGSSTYSSATFRCQHLQLAGQKDWRLATASELQSIYDPKAESPGAIPRTRWQDPEATTFHVKGNLFLTGAEWVNTGDNDDGNPSQDRLVFDFQGRRLVTEKRYFVNAGALCVRGTAK